MSDAVKPAILCVDDDRNWLTLMEHLLREGGYEVVTAGTGQEGLEKIRQKKVDLVLLDVGLPDMDGYEVCSKIQTTENGSYVPVLFLTARDSAQDKARAFETGGADYLVKPSSKQALLATVKRYIRTRVQWNSLVRGPLHTLTSFAEFKAFVFDRLEVAAEDRKRYAETSPFKLYDLAEWLGIGDAQIASYAAEFLHLTFLREIRMDDIQLGVLPRAFCQANGVVAAQRPEGGVDFAVTNPFNWELLDELNRMAEEKQSRRIFVVAPSTLGALFGPAAAPVGRVREPDTKRMPAAPPLPAARTGKGPAAAVSIAEIEKELQALYKGPEQTAEVTDVRGDTAPVIMLVDQLIDKAVASGASDIHIEPWESEVVVRYRIDGDLREVLRLKPRRLIQPIVSRIKIISRLDIAERRLPQDGRIVFRDKVDLRVSTAPQLYGEKAVLRILDQRKSIVPLETLGFSDRQLKRYRERIRTPYGLILHVGPTGSGKTTTLFAALNVLKDPTLNVQTIEDPIEYTLPGVNQMQVRPDIGLSFHHALRSFLRQDPDVILVGEIRDRETAEVAVEAALTGHLLLSTLHTNDAASTVVRFIELGVEPFLVSSSIVTICAQRLVRRLCEKCRQAYRPGDRERRLAGLPGTSDVSLYRAAGCPDCEGSGYKGRVGVHEVMVVDDAIRTAITARGLTSESLKRLAVEQCGMTTLFWDAMEKARAGVTSVEEVLSQVRADDFDARPEWMFQEMGLPRPASRDVPPFAAEDLAGAGLRAGA